MRKVPRVRKKLSATAQAQVDAAETYLKRMKEGDKFTIETGDTIILIQCKSKVADFHITHFPK